MENWWRFLASESRSSALVLSQSRPVSHFSCHVSRINRIGLHDSD